MLGSNFALLVKSPGDDGQQLLTTGSSYVYRCCIDTRKTTNKKSGGSGIVTSATKYDRFIDLMFAILR